MNEPPLLEAFYDSITKDIFELQSFGSETFELGKSSTLGFVGIAVQDTRTLLVGLQNILAVHLKRPAVQLQLGTPENIDTSNDFLSAMKGVHRYFFIVIQSALEAAAQKVLEEKGIDGVNGERAFRRVLSSLEKGVREEWAFFYEGLKVLRNESAHVSKHELHEKAVEKLQKAGLDFLVSDGKLTIRSERYVSISERATACVRDLTK